MLKRSWDYGGRAVFVGRTRHGQGFAERVRRRTARCSGGEALCARAAKDTVGGGFVVQEDRRDRAGITCYCSGPAQIPTGLFVDFSAYASVGLPEQPKWGGVCRGSISHHREHRRRWRRDSADHRRRREVAAQRVHRAWGK